MQTEPIPPDVTKASAPRSRERSERSDAAHTTMRVTKRNGQAEAVDLDKIVRAVNRCCTGLTEVDALRVATRTISCQSPLSVASSAPSVAP